MCMHAYKGGKVVRALTSHQRDLGLNPSVEAIYELSLLLVLSLALRGFFQVLWFSFLLRNQYFQIPIQFRTQRDISTIKFLKTPKCSVGKQITKSHFYKYRLPNIHLFRAGFISNHLRGHPCNRPSKGHLGTLITKFFTRAKVRYLEHIICTYEDTETREKKVKGAHEPKARMAGA